MYSGTVYQTSDIMCDSFCIACAMKRTIEKSESSQQVPARKIEHNPIKIGDLKPGDRVSMDQYSSNTRERLAKAYGKAPINKKRMAAVLSLSIIQVDSYTSSIK